MKINNLERKVGQVLAAQQLFASLADLELISWTDAYYLHTFMAQRLTVLEMAR